MFINLQMVENLGLKHLEIMNGLITDLLIDPINPNILYIAYMQRHRTVDIFRWWSRNQFINQMMEEIIGLNLKMDFQLVIWGKLV